MKYLRLLLGLVLFFPLLAAAQDSADVAFDSLPVPNKSYKPEKFYGIKLGAAHTVLQDRIHMPLNYNGAGATMGGFYERTKRKKKQVFAFDMHFSSLKDRLGFEAIYAYPRLQYAYTWQFTSDSNARFKAFAGPLAEAQYNFYYFLQTDDSHLRWLTQYHFGAYISADIDVFKSRKLHVSAGIPLVRFYSRMPEPITNSNFNPAFSKIVNMIHSDMQDMIGAGGFRFNASVPLIQSEKNTMAVGYEYFVVNFDYAFIQTNSITLKLARRK